MTRLTEYDHKTTIVAMLSFDSTSECLRRVTAMKVEITINSTLASFLLQRDYLITVVTSQSHSNAYVVTMPLHKCILYMHSKFQDYHSIYFSLQNRLSSMQIKFQIKSENIPTLCLQSNPLSTHLYWPVSQWYHLQNLEYYKNLQTQHTTILLDTPTKQT